MAEVTNCIAVFGLAIAALIVWVPGFGIPISGAVTAQCLRIMASEYSILPTDQRRVIAKYAKWLGGIVD